MYGNSLSKLSKLSFHFRDCLLIFSGMILHSLGVTYTSDIDMLLILTSGENENYRNLFREFEGYKEYEYFKLLKDGDWYRSDDRKESYCKFLLNELFPKRCGAKDIWEIMLNPRYYYTIKGIKFVCIDFIVQRLLNRFRSFAVMDLFMMKHTLGYPLRNFCFPKKIYFYGEIRHLNEKYREDTLKDVSRKLKKYFNLNYSYMDLMKEIKMC